LDRRRLGNEGFDLLPLLIGQIHYASTHRTYLRRDTYTKNIKSTRAYFMRDITRLSPIPGFTTACSDRVKKGMVLCRERHPIFPESDLVENLKIAAYLRKRSEVSAAIDYVFHLFPTLVRLRSRKAGFLRGGEQQMLTIGMA
jgi:hypothetical protein